MNLCPVHTATHLLLRLEPAHTSSPPRTPELWHFPSGSLQGTPHSQEECFTLHCGLTKVALLKLLSSQSNYLTATVITPCEIFFIRCTWPISGHKCCQSGVCATFTAVASTPNDASVSASGSLESIILQSREREQRYLALDPALLDFNEKLWNIWNPVPEDAEVGKGKVCYNRYKKSSHFLTTWVSNLNLTSGEMLFSIDARQRKHKTKSKGKQCNSESQKCQHLK